MSYSFADIDFNDHMQNVFLRFKIGGFGDWHYGKLIKGKPDIPDGYWYLRIFEPEKPLHPEILATRLVMTYKYALIQPDATEYEILTINKEQFPFFTAS